MENEQTTTLDALDASLNDLLKAASRVTGEPLVKGDGVNIDNSGTHGSDGMQGGGQGSMSDAGSIENLMIGKLTAAGFNAGQAATIVGMMKDVGGDSFFQHQRPSPSMSGKARGPKMPPFAGAAEDDLDDEDDFEDEDEDEDEDEEQPVGMRGKRRMGKSASFDSQFRRDPDIGEVVDVSPFLETLTSRTTEALDTLDRRMRKSLRRSDEQFVAMAKTVHALGALVKSQQHVINELGKRLGVVERQPVAAPKGVTSLSGAQPMQKSMPNEAGGLGSLKKSEIASVLTYMHLEKGVKEIGGRKIATDLVPLVESSAEVPSNILGEVQNFLRRHPGEAGLAKSYA
jgi:hypothetical protein